MVVTATGAKSIRYCEGFRYITQKCVVMRSRFHVLLLIIYFGIIILFLSDYYSNTMAEQETTKIAPNTIVCFDSPCNFESFTVNKFQNFKDSLTYNKEKALANFLDKHKTNDLVRQQKVEQFTRAADGYLNGAHSLMLLGKLYEAAQGQNKTSIGEMLVYLRKTVARLQQLYRTNRTLFLVSEARAAKFFDLESDDYSTSDAKQLREAIKAEEKEREKEEKEKEKEKDREKERKSGDKQNNNYRNNRFTPYPKPFRPMNPMSYGMMNGYMPSMPQMQMPPMMPMGMGMFSGGMPRQPNPMAGKCFKCHEPGHGWQQCTKP